ncbi:MAG: cobalamin synthesis protein [Hyphomicrobiales bacterium]|nr:cobalamin synthesis protein [Hyphomicrobiales bacterium]
MAKRAQVPIVLLTGFLGTGKTSLLKRWIREPEFSGAMVIVNELGEVGLDQQILTMGGDVPLLLENGCACCESTGDLVAMLERLFYDRLHRKITAFSWVLIETTGLADPKALLARLSESEIVRERYALAGVVTTFDAAKGPAQLLRHPEVSSQLDCADVVVVTRSDIAGAVDGEALELARRMRPEIPVLESATEGIPAASLRAALGTVSQPWERFHTAAEHTPDISTAFLPLKEAISWTALEAALQQVQSDDAVLRIKGLVRLTGCETPEIVQASDTITREPSPGRPDSALGLTIIAQGVHASAIAATLASRLTFRGLSSRR